MRLENPNWLRITQAWAWHQLKPQLEGMLCRRLHSQLWGQLEVRQGPPHWGHMRRQLRDSLEGA